jgi:hypothetical protein
LTFTLIDKQLLEILKGQPNMKVASIIRTVKEIYDGYQISYGKAWREKQRAWKVYLGLCSVVFLVPSVVRGVQANFTHMLNWWLHISTAVVDVVSFTGWSSTGSSPSPLVP